MGAIDESRKLMQDFLAPELRAITAKLESIDKRLDGMDKRMDAMDRRFERLEQQFDHRFNDLERRIDGKAQEAEKRADDRYQAIQMSFVSLTNYNELRERMLTLEREAVRRRELELEKQTTHQ